ncbi:conserved Plasmodium protein, unknown function [Plasmodium chabaudi chabaudi]|uniref:Uncharacterized protein n=1 Tax=Plasmodium chabaudi chabaudi TaxID=31271 RepID=A0A1C6Y8J9_PLACU|nr:conserved Plasmodium protein, unknown function [Plasmodium chabaudi chabaudi]
MITKSANPEKIVTPIINKQNIEPIKIKTLHELEYELNNKIYTNIYSYNQLCNGIYVCRGINSITGKKNSGKTSLCSHICVNIYFNDLLQFFHLFYSTYFDFEIFLQNKNIENKISSKTLRDLNKIRNGFKNQNTSFEELIELVKYFYSLFIELFEKEYDGVNNNHSKVLKAIYNLSKDTSKKYNNSFSKKRVIYLDLDNSFYIERYKNMIYSSIDKLKKLLNTYIDFCSEKKTYLFLLLFQNFNNLTNERKSFNLFFSNTYEECNIFINTFNKYLKKYINNITFSEVLLNLQILKIFNFQELINVIQYIYKHTQKYEQNLFKYFNKYVPSNLGALVIDNLNYLYKSSSCYDNLNSLTSSNNKKNSINNEFINLLKILSKLSTEHKIAVLVTKNKNNFFNKYEEYFNTHYSKYLYNNINIKFITHKLFWEYNSQVNGNIPSQFENKNKKYDKHNRDKKLNIDSFNNSSSSDESFQQLEENSDLSFCEKRYNQRYIKIKKKGKITMCFFEITEYGIQTLLN